MNVLVAHHCRNRLNQSIFDRPRCILHSPRCWKLGESLAAKKSSLFLPTKQGKWLGIVKMDTCWVHPCECFGTTLADESAMPMKLVDENYKSKSVFFRATKQCRLSLDKFPVPWIGWPYATFLARPRARQYCTKIETKFDPTHKENSWNYLLCKSLGVLQSFTILKPSISRIRWNSSQPPVAK